MRMRPSQSSVMKRKVGSTASLTTVKIQSIPVADGSPIMHARATQRIHAQIQFRAANDIEVDHLAKIGDILGHEIVRFSGGRLEARC